MNENIFTNQMASRADAVTPSDSTVLNAGILYVGTAGNVAVTTLGGSTATFVGVPAGTILYVLVTQVLSTNTTASNILILR